MALQQILVLATFVFLALVGLMDHRPASLALIPDPLDAGGYPTIAGVLLLLSLGLTFLEDVRVKSRGILTVIPPMNRKVLLMMILLGLYIAAFEYIGFYVGTFAFCVAALLAGNSEERPTPSRVTAYCLGTLLFWVVILKGFNLYLPSGLLL